MATSPSTNNQQQQHYQYYSAIVAVNSCGQKPTLQSTQHMQNFTGLSSREYAPKVLFNISSTPFKCSSNHQSSNSPSQLLATPSAGGCSGSNVKRRCSPVAAAREPSQKKAENVPSENNSEPNCDQQNSAEAIATVPQLEISPNKSKQYNAEKNQLLNSAMLNIEKAFEKTSQLKTFIDGSGNAVINTSTTSQDDSGNYSRNENCDGSSTSCTSSSDLTNIDTNNSITKVNDNHKSISCSSIELPEDVAPELVCVRLCSLLKDQLVKCLDEIREKYYKDDQVKLVDVIEDYVDDETLETFIDFENTQDAEEMEIIEQLITKDNSDFNMGSNCNVVNMEMSSPPLKSCDTVDVVEVIDMEISSFPNKQLTAKTSDTVGATEGLTVTSNANGSTITSISSSGKSNCDEVAMKISPTTSSNAQPSNDVVIKSSDLEDISNKSIEAGLHVLNANPECFQLLSTAPKTHKFHLTIFHPSNTQQYYKAVQKEHRMLRSSLPPGVWVR